MGMSNTPDPRVLLENSRVLFNREEVSAAVQKMADEINAFYGDEPLVVISVLTGAIIPAAWLVTKLKMPVQMDFVHATRYRGGLYGAELEYRVPPRLNLEGRNVLIIDDIFDEGNTLAAIKGSVEKRKAGSVKMAALGAQGPRPWSVRGTMSILSVLMCRMCTYLAVVWMPMKNGGTWMKYWCSETSDATQRDSGAGRLRCSAWV